MLTEKDIMKRMVFILFVVLFSLISCDDGTPIEPTIDIKVPVLIQVNPINDHIAKLKWSYTDSCDTRFIIYRSLNNSDFFTHSVTNTYMTTWSDSGLITTQPYYYRISALIDKNESNPSNILSVTTIFPGPVSVSAEPVNDNTIRVKWEVHEEYGSIYSVYVYRIERKNEKTDYHLIAQVSDTTTFLMDSNIELNTSYQYRVCAVNRINHSLFTESTAENTTFLGPSDLQAIAVDDQQIQLSWIDNSSFESGFEIERNDGDGYFVIANLLENSTEYIDEGLSFGVVYYYRVRAYTPSNYSNYSEPELGGTIFPAPSNLNTESLDDQRIYLSWTDNCTFESGFIIERNDGDGFKIITELPTNTTNFFDEELTYDTAYEYRVCAFTPNNQSHYSNIERCETVFPPPSGLEAAFIDNRTLHLTWEDNCSFESGYLIERDVGEGFVKIAEVDKNITEYTDENLEYILYKYRIRAFTDRNISHCSDTAGNYSSDIDGNIYRTVKIGNQVWMAENLKVTHFNNGEPIPQANINLWYDMYLGLCEPTSFCAAYKDNPENKDIYGLLYNWYAINDSRGLVPVGWRVPDIFDWYELIEFLGGDNLASQKLKSKTGWNSGNGTDEVGFTVLPAGIRMSSLGNDKYLGGWASFWTVSKYNDYHGYAFVFLSFIDQRKINMKDGQSIRCVQDL
jgi:uncharacterized protein (TIGR02145 family)